MSAQSFTEYTQNKIKEIDIERLASESNVIGVAEKISELAQLLTRINQELSNRLWAYNMKVNFILSEEKISVAQARVKADASSEAKDLLQVKLLKESVVSMIQSLKYLARSLRDEYDVAQHT